MMMVRLGISLTFMKKKIDQNKKTGFIFISMEFARKIFR